MQRRVRSRPVQWSALRPELTPIAGLTVAYGRPRVPHDRLHLIELRPALTMLVMGNMATFAANFARHTLAARVVATEGLG
jgi:hypothetical protein